MIPWNKGKEVLALKGHPDWRTSEVIERSKIQLKELGLKRRGIMPKNLHMLVGKNHWNWKGGISRIERKIRRMKEYLNWRTAIFMRDNYLCVDCGKTDCYITAHHIKSFVNIIKDNKIKTMNDAKNCSEMWDINNGKTLCENCHEKTDNYKARAKMPNGLTLSQFCGV